MGKGGVKSRDKRDGVERLSVGDESGSTLSTNLSIFIAFFTFTSSLLSWKCDSIILMNTPDAAMAAVIWSMRAQGRGTRDEGQWRGRLRRQRRLQRWAMLVRTIRHLID